MKINKSLQYALYVIVHPFDGFYWLKKEKKGNCLSATILIVMLITLSCIEKNVRGFMVSPLSYGYPINLIYMVNLIVIPVCIWCIANWSVSSIFDGKGTLKDIYICSAYSLTPLILVKIPDMILSQVVIANDLPLYTFMNGVAILWTGFLLFFGIMMIHELDLKMTFWTIILAIIAMLFIVIISMIFFSLMQQMYNFIYMIYRELSLRV